MFIRLIFFDFVGVLLCQRPGYQPAPQVEAVDALVGRVTDDAQFRALAQRNLGLSEAEFEGALQSIADKYTPFQPLWALLPQLRKRYRLAVINNGTWLTYPLFNARLALDQTFDLFISSAREGLCKPDERLYARACQKAGVAAGQCLFMDDGLENVASARRVGMQGIHWPDHAAGFERFVEFLKQQDFRG